MFSEVSETPLKQVAANIIGTEGGKEANNIEAITSTRKIEFDRGIPFSFDFASNEVKTIDYSGLSITSSVLRKLFAHPLNIFMMILFVFYTIAYLCAPYEIMSLKLSTTIYVHLCIFFLEICWDLLITLQIYRNDVKTNSQHARIYDIEYKCFVSATWADVRVGHIIRVNKDEIVPADIIILETMDSNHQCYLDASAITGVFDSFIIKKACNDTQAPSTKSIKFNEYVKNIKGMLKYEEPNSNIHSFNGRLKIESFPRASDIKEENFVMRGSTIKNIACVYGIVVYTGMETKIMQILKNDKTSGNSNIVKEDRNIILKTFGFLQIVIIGLYLVLLFLLGLIHLQKSYKTTLGTYGSDHIYLELYQEGQRNNYNIFIEFFFSFFQYMYTFHLIIPFTWFGMISIAYNILILFIKWDVKVRQQSRNCVDIINNDCIADFGQVRYILADKTGTLTSRKFLLKACSIHGKLYSFDPLDRRDENYIFRMKNCDMTDLELYQELKSNSSFSVYIKQFLEYLCICHSVKIRTDDSKKDSDVLNNETIFGSSYAEERSTLKMLMKLGYAVKKTKKHQIFLDIGGSEKKIYMTIGTNRYSDERKRMSVIVKKDKDDMESVLLCKGSDFSIFKHVKTDNETEAAILKDQIKKLSSIGYRYFIFCKKDLSEDETTSYMTKYKSAENYVLQREAHYESLALEYEKDMEVLGVLFFEEKVSSDLRYSINKLNNSNIYTWIVSGDKKENVLAVSKNLDIYKPHSIIVEFSEKDNEDDLDIKMNMFLMQFLVPGEQMLRMKTRRGVDINVEAGNVGKIKSKELTILIHGSCFSVICADPRLYQFFSTLLSYTTHLFAYSFTSNNKYILCQTVKKYITKNSKVLAIGDGLNDFMMLKEADLSIGIRSREILQVRNTCDVIVSKFPQIVDLILVHGTWNFQRMFQICVNSFYANFLIIFPIFLHQNSNSEGSTFFELNYTILTLDILIINCSIIFLYCFDTQIERPLIGLNSNVYLENFFDKMKIMLHFAKAFIKATADSFIIYYSFFIIRNPLNILGENIDSCILGWAVIYTSYAVIFFKLFTLKLKTVNFAIIFIAVVTLGVLVGLVFIDKEVVIVMYQGASYLNIVLCSIFAIVVSFLYEYISRWMMMMTNPDFLYRLTMRFKAFISDYMLFINFEEVVKKISGISSGHSKSIDKITYPEVLQKINEHNDCVDPVLENMTDINNDQIASLKIRKPFLKFYDEKLENDYLSYTANNIGIPFFCFLASLLFFWIVDIILQSVWSNLSDEKITKILKIIYILSGLIILMKPLKVNFKRNFTIYYYCYLVIELICIYVEKSDNDTKICVQNFLLFTFPLIFSNRNFTAVVVGLILYCIGIIPSVFINDFDFSIIYTNEHFLYSNLPLLYHRTVFIVITLVTVIVYSYYEELSSRIDFLKYHKRVLELKKDDEIYSNLVPEFVREKMKSGLRGAAVDYEIVTIIFCDICDFDKLIASMSPKDIIFLLDRIYNSFDQLCPLHGMQKIETVGKTYMAAGGIKECEKDVDPIILQKHHGIRTFEMAIDILDVIQKMTLETGEFVRVKIGIHTGKVIASVVGSHKPQFSLIGDTVNTTARMCYYSSENCINCSEFSYEHISKAYCKDFEVSTKEIKGKGKMNLYLYNPNKSKHAILESRVKMIKESSQLLVKSQFRQQQSIKRNQPTAGMIRQNSRRAQQEVNNTPMLKKQGSMFSNQSVFLYENSYEIKDVLSSRERKSDKKLSKSMTKMDGCGNANVKAEPNVDRNTIYDDSTLFLKFNDPNVKDTFTSFESHKFNNSEVKSSVINYLYVGVWTIGIYNISQYAMERDSKFFAFIIVEALLLSGLVIIIFYTKEFIQSKPSVLRLLNGLIYLLFTISDQIKMNYMADHFLLNVFMEQIVVILAVTFNGMLSYQQIAMNHCIYILIFIINIAVNSHNHFYVKYLIFAISICLISFGFIVLRYYIATYEYLRNQRESKNLKEMERFLFNLMPPHVIQNLKEDIPVADVLDTVTMLFADIVRFTDYSSERDPVEVVKMLSQLFQEFDDSCKETNVYKVHTIGDCYVVMGFTGKVPLNERNYLDEAKNVISMGERMIKIIRRVRKDVNFEKLDMRIGLHTGTVIAGIIGTKVVRYDIFGSDVLIANKMEAGGEPGRINVSEYTKALLEDAEKESLKYQFSPNKPVSIPSLNKEVKCFFISQKDCEANE